MSKKVRIALEGIQKIKGRSDWPYLRYQTDGQIRANVAGDRNSRELSDTELRYLEKPKKR